MAYTTQEKITVTLSGHIKEQVSQLKEEAQIMVSEYENNPEILELCGFEEDIREY